MQLMFERGDAQRPKGHALVYFRDSDSPGVLATYLVVAGDASAAQIEQLLTYTTEAAQLYFHMYEDFARGFPEVSSPEVAEAVQGPSAEELTYALMGERERLGELA